MKQIIIWIIVIIVLAVPSTAEYNNILSIIGSIDREGIMNISSLYYGPGLQSPSYDEDYYGIVFNFRTYTDEWDLIREINSGSSFYTADGRSLLLTGINIRIPADNARYLVVMKDDETTTIIDLKDYACNSLCDGCEKMGIDCKDENNITQIITPPPVIVDDEPDMNIVLVASIFLVFFLAIVFIGVWRGKHGSKND